MTAPVEALSLVMPPVVKQPTQTLPSEAGASWWANEIDVELWNNPTDAPASV